MKYTAEEAKKVPVFKLLWALQDDLYEANNDVSSVDSAGTIISWYATIIESRINREEKT